MLIDVSLPLREGMVLRPGSPPLEIKYTKCRSRKEGEYTTPVFSSPLHTGTHIDLVYKERSIPSDRLIGTGRLVNVSHIGEKVIRLEDIKDPGIEEGDFVFFYTGWDKRLFKKEYSEHPELAMEVVEWLASKRINMVGIDALGLARLDKHVSYDRYLVEREIYIIENLVNISSLQDIEAFKVYCFPLNIVGVDALPTRVIAETSLD